MGFDPRDFFDEDSLWHLGGVYFICIVLFLCLVQLAEWYLQW